MAKHRRIFDHNGVIERKPLPKMRPQPEAQEEEELPAGQAYHMDGTLTRGNILALQHTIGNTAVQRVLARGSLPAASGVIQRNFSIYAIKDLLGKDTFERIRAETFPTGKKYDAFALLEKCNSIDEVNFAVEQLFATNYNIEEVSATVAFLAPYLPKTSANFPLARQYYTQFAGDSSKTKAVLDFLLQYTPQSDPKFGIAREQLERVNYDTSVAKTVTDFLLHYFALGPKVYGVAKQHLLAANYDTTVATATLDPLKPYNYDESLKIRAEAQGELAAKETKQAGETAAEQAKVNALLPENIKKQIIENNKSKPQHKRSEEEEPVEPQGKKANKTSVGRYKKAKTLYDAAVLEVNTQIDTTYAAAIQQAEENAQKAKAAVLQKFTAFLATATSKVGEDVAKNIISLPEVRNDGTRASAVLPFFEYFKGDEAQATLLATWALTSSDASTLPNLVQFTLHALQQPVVQATAQTLASTLASRKFPTANGLALIDQVKRGASDEQVNKRVAFITRNDSDLTIAKAAFEKATSDITVDTLIALPEQYTASEMVWALDTLNSLSLTTLADAKEVLGLLRRDAPKLNRSQVKELLTLQPNPKKVRSDLEKRQSDPAKLKSMLANITKDEPVTGGSTPATKKVVDRENLKLLATQDPTLETQRLLDLGVSPKKLIDATATDMLKPVRLAAITKDQKTEPDATTLVDYATDRAEWINKLIDDRNFDTDIVKRMHTKSITVDESEEMSRFEHKAAPAEKKLGSYGTARLDHFAMRHTYKHFQFSAGNIDASNTQWPEGTDAATLEGYALTAAQAVHPNPATSPITTYTTYYTAAGGVNVVIGFDTWNNKANSITQFYPQAGDQYDSAKMTRFKDAFKKP